MAKKAAKKAAGKKGKSSKGGGKAKAAAASGAMKAKRYFKMFMIAVAALIVFIIVFPLARPLETMTQREAAKDGKFITLDNGITLHYYEAGEGEPLLLIHGFLSYGYTWKDNIPALAAAGYHVIAPDLPGYGFSDKPSGIEYNYKTFSDTMKQLLDAKKIGRVSLVGNSMGGGVSIRFAIDNPGRVKKLVLVDSSGVRHGPNTLFKLLTVPGLNRFMSSTLTPGTMKAIIGGTMFYDSKKVTAEKAESYFAPLRTRGSFDASQKTLKGNKFDFPDTELKKIAAPTLLIWGEQDKVINPAVANVFHSRIKGAELVFIPKCGHLPQEEKPVEFNKALTVFLNSKKK